MKQKVIDYIKKIACRLIGFTKSRHTNPYVDMLLCVCMALVAMSLFYENNKYAFMLKPSFENLVFSFVDKHLLTDDLAFQLVTGVVFLRKIITTLFLYVFITFSFANGLNRKYSFAIFTASYWLIPSGFISFYLNSSPNGFLATNKLSVAFFNVSRHLTEITISSLSQHYYEIYNIDPAVTSIVVVVILLLIYFIGVGVNAILNRQYSLTIWGSQKKLRRI